MLVQCLKLPFHHIGISRVILDGMGDRNLNSSFKLAEDYVFYDLGCVCIFKESYSVLGKCNGYV